MLVQSLFDVISSAQVFGGKVILINGLSEVSSSLKRVNKGHASPEEIGVSGFFPEITSIRLPVVCYPVHVVGNKGENIIGLIIGTSLY